MALRGSPARHPAVMAVEAAMAVALSGRASTTSVFSSSYRIPLFQVTSFKAARAARAARAAAGFSRVSPLPGARAAVRLPADLRPRTPMPRFGAALLQATPQQQVIA